MTQSRQRSAERLSIRKALKEPAGSQKSLWVAGIAGSAGGIEALQEFFSFMHPDTGMAFIVAQHAAPGSENKLAQFLARNNPLPVRVVKHGLKLRGNHVYVVPSGMKVRVKNGSFAIPGTAVPKPVNELFRSIAEEYKNCSIGVVLSGTGDDGAEGLAFIKQAGGRIYVQSEESADFPGMPAAALRASSADGVLSPSGIVREINELGQAGSCRLDDDLKRIDHAAMEKIFKIIYDRTRLDFSSYKSTTIQRRIGRRMHISGIKDVDGYLKVLRSDPEEIGRLYDDMLINVTRFFRDRESFDALRKKFFASMLKGGRKNIRLWVPGCSTGEEVYSLAITLFEFLGPERSKIGIQIFGTDVSERSLEKARNGFYKPGIADCVSPAQLREFFVKVHGGYQIAKFIRDVCVFARQDVTRDPPFSRVDLISCRNLLIYLDSTLQDRVIKVFHYALNSGGYLMLGNAESIRQYGHLFEAADKRINLFTKKDVSSSDVSFTVMPYSSLGGTGGLPLQRPAHGAAEKEILREMDHLIAENAPVSILVNEELEVLQFRGDVRQFLDFPAGKASLNLQRMIKGIVLFDVKEMIEKIRANPRRRALKKVTECKIRGKYKVISLQAIPLKSPAVYGKVFLILFQDVSAPEAERPRGPKTDTRESREISRIKKELEVTREFLEAGIEKHESMNEELRSANEEILSSNEELQSMNEELETAKEELQSTNEELTTVNESLKKSLEELRVSNDLLAEAQALAHLGSWTWDIQTNRVTWSGELYRIYGVNAGALISYETVLSLVHPDDRKTFDLEIRRALKTREPFRFHHRIIRPDGKTHIILARGQAIRNDKGKVVRMTGTGQDITDMLSMERSLQETEEKFRLLVEQVQDYAIYLLDPEGRIQTWNTGAQRIKGYTRKEILGRHYSCFFTRADREAGRPAAELKAARAKGVVQCEGWRVRKDGSRFWAHVTVTALYDDQRKLRGFAKVTRDMSEKKRAEELLKQANAELERRVEERTRDLAASEKRYQDLYQNAPDMLLSVDVRTKRIVQCNQTLLKTLGYGEKEVVGKRTYDLYEPGSHAKLREAYARFMKTGVIENCELVVLAKDGKRVDIVLNATAFRDAKGRIIQTRSSWRDISLRKAAERALIESEAKFRTMADSAPVLIWMSGTDGACHYFNKGWLDFTGRTLARELGKGWAAGVHPEDAASRRTAYEKALKDRKPFLVEYRLRRRDGAWRWVLDRGVPLYAGQSEFRGFIGSCIDITDRKESEESIKRSEERFRSLVNATSSVVWTADAKGQLIERQKSWESFTGQNWEEYRGFGWKKALHPGDADEVEQKWAAAVKAGRPFLAEGRVWSKKHGEHRHALIKAAPVFNHKQEIREWIGTVTDIHQQKKAEAAYSASERRFKSTFYNAAVGIAHTNLAGHYTLVNRKFCEITGYSERGILEKTYEEITYPEDRKKDRLLRDRLFAGEIENFNIEKRYVHRRGSILWVEITVSLLKDENDKPLGTIAVVEDITPRKMAEAALEESRERLAAALEASDTGTFRWYFDTGLVEWDSSLRKLFGLGKTDRIEKIDDFIERVHPADRKKVLEAVRRTAAEGAEFFLTCRIVRPDGKVRWILEKGKVTRGEENKPVYMSGACVDVTAYKEAEKALRLSEQRLGLVVESTEIGLWYCDLPLDKLIWNDKCKAHFGLAPDAEVTIDTFYERIHPEDREKTRHAIAEAIEESKAYDIVYRTVRQDGGVNWIRAIGRTALDDKGKPVSMDGVTIDVSEQKQIQEQLQRQNRMLTTLNSVGRTLSAELDLHNLVQYVTDAATTLCQAQFGAFFYNFKEEGKDEYTLYTVSGMAREHFEKFPLPRDTALFRPTFAGEGTVLIPDVKADPRYGRNVPFFGVPEGHLPVTSYLAVPVMSRSGEVIGGLFFGHRDADVFTPDHARMVEALAAQAAIAMDNARLYQSLQKELAEKQAAGETLARQAEALYRSNEDLRQFAYIASHDLQEPLRTVTTFSELLSEEYQADFDEKAREYMTITVQAARRAQNLVDDLLNYCRLDRPDNDSDEVDLAVVVAQTLENLKPAIDTAGAVVSVSDLPVLKANRVQIGQLFQNLISNAIKFRGAEPPKIEIQAEQKKDEWLFSVRDNGIGLDEIYAEKIFVIFQRLHHRSEYEGTGIGLAICKRIVERHGGKIWVKSEPGRGATFYFTIKT